MKIRTQDGDRSYNITKVFYEAHSYQEIFLGWNIYGISKSGRKYLLGTRDTAQEAEQIVLEIRKLEEKGASTYAIPALVDDYEAEDFIARLEERFL